MVAQAYNAALVRFGKENPEFKVSLGYIQTLSQNTKTNCQQVEDSSFYSYIGTVPSIPQCCQKLG